MSKSKHTQGDWRLEWGKTGESASLVVFTESDGEKLVIAEINGPANEDLRGELMGNAHLIHGSRDLLEAAEERVAKGCNDTCSSQLSKEFQCDCGHEKLCAAIAKAKGR